jgi:hypothetical protein
MQAVDRLVRLNRAIVHVDAAAETLHLPEQMSMLDSAHDDAIEGP